MRFYDLTFQDGANDQEPDSTNHSRFYGYHFLHPPRRGGSLRYR